MQTQPQYFAFTLSTLWKFLLNIKINSGEENVNQIKTNIKFVSTAVKHISRIVKRSTEQSSTSGANTRLAGQKIILRKTNIFNIRLLSTSGSPEQSITSIFSVIIINSLARSSKLCWSQWPLSTVHYLSIVVIVQFL